MVEQQKLVVRPAKRCGTIVLEDPTPCGSCELDLFCCHVPNGSPVAYHLEDVSEFVLPLEDEVAGYRRW